jgi:hypothetical protein
MGEPASTAGAVFGAKMASALGAGALGALVMAMVDPPKTRGQLAAQSFVAGVCSIVGTPLTARWLDSVFDFIDLSATASVPQVLEVFTPVAFLIGALSWGIMGALVQFRRMVRERGAAKLAKAAGLDPETGPGAL